MNIYGHILSLIEWRNSAIASAHGYIPVNGKSLVEKLYPINRSILGEGYRKSLSLLNQQGRFKLFAHATGEEVLDWIIPPEWSVREAWIADSTGEKVIDLKNHNLHLMNYSIPIDKYLSLPELQKHLYTIPEQPKAIPYVTSYYNRDWGFCLAHQDYLALSDDTYHVYIDSTLDDGALIYGHYRKNGQSNDSLLLSSYLCHSQLANHELGGPLLISYLAKLLEELTDPIYSYDCFICPENIGAAAILSDHGDQLIKNTKAGFVMNCLGHGQDWVLKAPRNEAKLPSILTKLAIPKTNNLKMVKFFPDGSDERQYCSPGFDLPVAVLMREMYGTFSEYHTSLDDLSFIDYQCLQSSLEAFINIIFIMELDFRPIATVQRGTPMLNKYGDLYPKRMEFRSVDKGEFINTMLVILNQCDGTKSCLDICNEWSIRPTVFCEVLTTLIEKNLIHEDA